MAIEQKIHNKKIDITASFINALAIGAFAGGVIKPLINLADGQAAAFRDMHIVLLIAGVGLHMFARKLADYLIEE